MDDLPWEGEPMKRMLSLDIGITTGFAVLTVETQELLECGEITEHSFRQELKILRDRHIVSHSVAERPVIVRGRLGDRLQKLIAITDQELMRQVEWIEPSRWKGTPASKKQTPRGTSQHVKDAIRIGYWYLGRL